MKRTLLFFALISLSQYVHGQDVNGKWYGKLTQGPGGYSQLYDIELDIVQKKSIYGQSISSLSNAIDIRLGFWGKLDKDSIRLEEAKSLLIGSAIVPLTYEACVKKINVAYQLVGSREYLQGSWNGVSIEDSSQACIPGTVIFARNKADLKFFIDSIHTEILPPMVASEPPINFATPFSETKVVKAQEIEVKNLKLKLQVRDYLNVDNDTVSIYLNRKPLAKSIWLGKRFRTIDFSIDRNLPLNEVIIYAENLGLVPPNTSEMFVIDGTSTHKLLIESDKQKSAAIYLRYKP